jgi:maltose alpha-D-glucosyltransferase/alpha-amylase
VATDTSQLTLPADPQAAPPPDPASDPLWYKDAIIYQAHVKSFFDGNNDGVGDFQGLAQKLDYLQSLGITCIWLLPFFPSPLRDDGYDIADYRSVHPSYGTLDDFKAFVDAAHARGLKVLIELVVNHTSDQHPWFQRARRAPRGSPEREFYVWSDSDKKFPETRIIFLDTEKSNWAYDPEAGAYYWHRFFSHQPDLNHNNPAVVDAVIDVMKFWLDLGVDALRLDAVPYLCVREGTSNENLPETHAVLRRMRRALDESYANRMLLAEANQWPADVRAYFGDGDECHMAFHFPLMPRMFMALRQEDRHAITEILSQTPEIPDTCQWALFLRNHDELTLEMVTDEERDYMYQVYAADPQMRLNLGIRRRLAPLVENSRRRIELLNSMLFSFPGTPVIYYGDEIGMGDNIYLGDRNGVRTPMQWSSDRNGGFSRADAARLFAPAIQDPVYGYQAINVEAQERYPFSPLNWTKRLIAMRQQHRVFGRGSLEFVACSNRKVLAYLRRDERETVLCVVNLSRSVQPAELDLQAFDGLIPIEMAGFTEFPRIGGKPYFLTLGPYASYWFLLQKESIQSAPRATETRDANAAIVDGLPALLAGVDWQTLLDSATRTVLERRALIPFLQRQRWFAAKSREIRSARFADWTLLRGGAHPSFLVVVSVDYADGRGDAYFIPLSLMSGPDAERALREFPARILALVTGARKGIIVDAMQDDDTCDRLLALIDSGSELVTTRGGIQGTAVPHAGSSRMTLEGDHRWVRGGGDQSNTVAFVNDALVLKVFRRIEPVTNPEFEIGRFFADRGFVRTPALAGALEYRRPGLDAGTLAVVQRAVKHQGTAWDFTIDEVRRYYERAAARMVPAHDTPESPFFEALVHYYIKGVETLGRRTAEMHMALADSRDAAFAPESLDTAAIALVSDEMVGNAGALLDRLASTLETLPEHTRETASAVLAVRDALINQLRTLRHIPDAGQRIRVHGDYHLGQVLRTEEDFVIVDFEGEPARTIGERRLKYSPLKDVAGMLRSFSYATYVSLFTFTVHSSRDYSALEAWGDNWQMSVAETFTRTYRTTLASSTTPHLVPQDGASWTTMLRSYAIDKALYELGYELDHRPEWVRIPLIGILKLVNLG